MSRSFVVICSCMSAGILSASLSGISFTGKAFIILWIAIMLSCLLLKKYFFIFLALSFVFLGIFVYENTAANRTILNNFASKPFCIILKVLTEAVDRKYYQEYDVRIMNVIKENAAIIVNEKAKLYLKGSDYKHSSFKPGDIIELREVGLLKELLHDADNTYEKHLRIKGYKSIIEGYADRIISIEASGQYSILFQSHKARKYIERLFDESLKPAHGNLAKSILLGNLGYMSREETELFSKTGTAHIISVSGLHVGIIVLFMHTFLNMMDISKRRILIITMVFLILYGYLVNFSVSIIRAIAMYFIYVLAYFTENRYDGINSLMIIAFVLFVHNPLNIYSISFQLSFSATLSILLFYPVLADRFSILPQKIGSLIAVTVAAQLGTIPIMIYHFEQLSVISVFANLLIVPVIGVVISMAFISILLSFFSVHIAYSLNVVNNAFLTYIYWTSELLDKIPYASVRIENIKPVTVIIYYIILGGLYFVLWNNKQKHQLRESRETYEL